MKLHEEPTKNCDIYVSWNPFVNGKKEKRKKEAKLVSRKRLCYLCELESVCQRKKGKAEKRSQISIPQKVVLSMWTGIRLSTEKRKSEKNEAERKSYRN
jgi:hypothetical protein